MQEKPNIHLFEVYGKKFLYDVDTNAIVKIPEKTFDYLYKVLTCASSKELKIILQNVDEEINNNIKFLEDQGLLHPVNGELRVEHIETGILRDMFDGNISMMTLQVTQNCNLRCKYCVYSGSYINRTHNNKRMEFRCLSRAASARIARRKLRVTARRNIQRVH